MTLDQATLALLNKMNETVGPTPIWEMDAAAARAAFAFDPSMFGDPPPMQRTEEVIIPTRDGAFIPAQLLVPVAHPRAFLVYLHGGGWVLGELSRFDTLARRLALRTESAVLLVDYRLAPEFPFPTPLHDCWDALCWANDKCRVLLGMKVPLLVGGDSAGGNLAAVVSRWARDRSGPGLAAQILIYPVTDADFSRASYLEDANQTLLPTPFMAWFWNMYLPDQDARQHPDASPLRASHLVGLPPALILTAQHDILRDEGQAYAAALATAGVEVEQHEIAGQMHGFFTMTGILPGSDIGMRKIANFVERIVSGISEHPAHGRDKKIGNATENIT